LNLRLLHRDQDVVGHPAATDGVEGERRSGLCDGCHEVSFASHRIDEALNRHGVYEKGGSFGGIRSIGQRQGAQWTGQQLVNAFPYDSTPEYLIRNRDKIYGAALVRGVRAMGIEQVVTARGCRTVGNAGEGSSSVRLVAFADTVAMISRWTTF
jgi:hypothetical protein